MNSLIIAGRLAAPSIGYAATRYIAPSLSTNSAFLNSLDVSRKRPALQLIGGPDPKRLKLTDFSKKSSKMPRARIRRGRRRRFRRGRKRFTRGRRVGFAKRVKRVIFRTLERKLRVHIGGGAGDLVMAEGDGVSRVIYVHSPLSDMSHGDEEDRFEGNNFWVKGLLLRGSLSMDLTTPTASSAIVRITLLFSKDQGTGFENAWGTFGNTTTAITNPVQVPPNVNPRFFQNTALPFVGLGYVAPFDTTRHKVIKSFMLPVNPTGDSEAGQFTAPTLFKCFVPIKRMMQVEDALQGPIATPGVRYKNGTYWWVAQVLASNAGTSTDPVVSMDAQSITYFRDP